MPTKTKFAYGKSENIATALEAKIIDAYDLLLLDSDTEPKIGWVDATGNPIVISNGEDEVISIDALPESGEASKIYIYQNEAYIWDATQSEFVTISKPADLSELEAKIDSKVDEQTVDSKIETAISSLSVDVVEF